MTQDSLSMPYADQVSYFYACATQYPAAAFPSYRQPKQSGVALASGQLRTRLSFGEERQHLS